MISKPRVKKEKDLDRQYWLWVTTPMYYLEADNTERICLEPQKNSDTGGWWTCSKNTKKGDFILLYRARGSFDIKYLIQAESDAYPLGHDDYAKGNNWSWGCEYRPIYKFKNPISISDLRNHDRLQDWNALKSQFRSKCFSINFENWKNLNDLLVKKNPTYRRFITKFEAIKIPESILLEEQLEKELVSKLDKLKKFGYNLELYYDKTLNLSGRQFVCRGFGGRIDILCRNKKSKGFTIIEIKNVQATRVTFAQICEYIGYIQDNIGKKKNVDGIVISRGYDSSFQQALKVLPKKIQLIDLVHLGYA